jgi:hypothetical protein
VCLCVCVCAWVVHLRRKRAQKKTKGFSCHAVSFEAKTGHPVQIGVSLDKWRPAHNKLIIWYRAKQ